VQIVCKNFYVQKLFLQFLLFLFTKLLMALWNSFANSWDLKTYFLKGIVELERYEAWNLALQINDVTPIKCGNAEICWAKNPVVSFIFRLQLISIWQFEPWRLNTMPKTLPHWESKINCEGGAKLFKWTGRNLFYYPPTPCSHKHRKLRLFGSYVWKLIAK